ncbi:PH domain-containing protein [Herbaspirillum autotrophicum]|uniref:hypothetical protein n=1 Tax=Herbaspirillum autotrophicum TaxID=180195 RepID=UPI000AF6D76A|nr:hypothetical protein [Herbaspirillum autotrophicum]
MGVRKTDFVKRALPYVAWPIMALLIYGTIAAILSKGLVSSESAGWVQATGSFGAIFAAIWIWLRQDQAVKDREDASIHQLILSIRDEVSLTWDNFSERSGKHLIESAPAAFMYRIPVSENAFVIYAKSADRIAEIADESLRKQIILTYGRGYGFIRTIQMNNILIEQWSEAEFQASHMGTPACFARRDATAKALVEYGPLIRDNYSRLESDVMKLLEIMPK